MKNTRNQNRYLDAFDPFGNERDHSDARWVDPSQRKTKYTHPYSYSEFFIFGDRSVLGRPGIHAIPEVHADYSDRLQQWNYAKFEEAGRSFKKRFDQFSAAEASQFLSTYYDKPIRCVALAEGCNVGNGYPYWIFWYVDDVKLVPA